MDESSDDLGEVAYVGKLKTQTFKQLQLERQIKSGTVIPASKLAETKELELQRVRDFEAAIADEERHRKAANHHSHEGVERMPLTRKRFEV
jgi:hypothetical protein